MANTEPLMRMENISKDFYGATVLSNVNLSIRSGEIVGLVGENGAGKTTLMNILFGMPSIAGTGGYSGQLYVNGKPAAFKSPSEALQAGIGMVHQEFSLIPGFKVYENIMLNRELTRFNLGAALFGERLATLQREQMKTHSRRSIAQLGIQIEPETEAGELPVGHKQFIEIAREIDREQVKLLVLDEPTAVLTEHEADILLSALKQLAHKEKTGIIFISHRLKELTQIAGRVVVLRDGRIIKDVANRNVTVLNIASWMMGRELGAVKRTYTPRALDGEALRVEHLWVDMPGETVRDVCFSVKKGEIFGIGGLAGQGKIGIANGIMGLYRAGGKVFLESTAVPLNNPKAVLDAGMAFVSEDRRGAGLLLDQSLDWNIAFGAMQIKGAYLKSYCNGLFKLRDGKAMQTLAEKYIKQLDIKCTGPKQNAKELSGGNQQKVCLSKAFALNPRLLFVSEPTRGIDVGAKQMVLDTLISCNRNEGITIVMVSSELEELRAMCDRIAIVDEGRIAGILSPEAPPAEYGLLMSGTNA